MNRIIIIAIVAVICFAAQVYATIINIPADYPTIQTGIDASTDGDTVLVQPGTYLENVVFNGHNIVLGSLFLTTGDTTYISQTIITGDDAGYGGVYFRQYEDSTSVLAGFTITNGSGVSCWNANPVIRNNIIVDNTYVWMPPMGSGGGIYCEFSNAKIIYNDIIGNFSFQGGGIYCDRSNALIMGNNIEGNMASFYGGGGIYCCNFSDVRIINNVIRNNEVGLDGNGGGIYYAGGNPLILNNTITDNYAEGFGGGLNCFLADAIIINNIFRGDSAGIGWEIRIDDGSHIISFNNIEGGWPGEGNIDTDPLLRDPENGDFHLMSIECGDPFDSPCIDTGDPSIDDILLNCDWGLEELRSDMGAYGGGDSVMVAIDDYIKNLPEKFALFQNYPNPFNPTTTIRYSLPQATDVRIEIYNIIGQRVATLFDGNKQAGYHTVTWLADDYPSGVYFARLETRTRSESIKMVLLK